MQKTGIGRREAGGNALWRTGTGAGGEGVGSMDLGGGMRRGGDARTVEGERVETFRKVYTKRLRSFKMWKRGDILSKT